MQRIRETDRGLQFTEGLDVITFSQYEDGLGVHRRASSIEGAGYDVNADSAHILIEGRDNLADLATWMQNRRSQATETDSVRSQFTEFTINEFAVAACISVVPELDDEKLKLRDLHDAVGSLVDALSELLGDKSVNPNRLDVQAFATPFGYDSDQEPIMLAKMTHDTLLLSRDGLHNRHTRIPYERAADLGAWIHACLGSVKKKSIWG